MKRLQVLGLVLALACTLIVVIVPIAAAAQDCSGSGNGDVGGYPLEESKPANLDGDGTKNDLVETFYDSTSGNARVRVTLDNGYQAVTPDRFVGFRIVIGAVRDADRDGDDEIFILELLGPNAQLVQPFAFAGCDLVVPQLDGAPFSGAFGGFSGGGSAGMDCFAPSQGGKGLTTYATDYLMQFDQYQSTRKEYKLNVDDAAGTATVVLAHEHVMTYTATKQQAVSAWRERFNCSPPPKCNGKSATIQGTPAKDLIIGTGKRDVVVGMAGNDTIKTKAGNDLICAGTGNDKVFAAAGADKAFGQLGSDTLYGGKGPDGLFGGKGKDTAFGGPGVDNCVAEVKNSC